jgi:hypothetical protein
MPFQIASIARLASMIVHDFHILGTVIPTKADAPLIVDADAVLTLAVALEGFEPIARRASEVCKLLARRQYLELAPGCPLDGFESPNRLIIRQRFRVPAAKALDHSGILYCFPEWLKPPEQVFAKARHLGSVQRLADFAV